jgi:hypothetical protein
MVLVGRRSSRQQRQRETSGGDGGGGGWLRELKTLIGLCLQQTSTKPKPKPLRMASNLLLNLNGKTQSWDVPTDDVNKEKREKLPEN